MNDSTNINIKWDHHGEFRRFLIPRNAVDLYKALMSKVEAVVPDQSIRLCWKDEDGDAVCFESHEEIAIAVASMKDKVLRVYTVDPKDNKQQTDKNFTTTRVLKERHAGVTCDHCDKPVFGMRYKCAFCPDFDLCEICEKEGYHGYHAMIRYATPRTPRLGREWGRPGFRRGTRGHSCVFTEGIFANTQAANVVTEAATAAAQRAAQAAMNMSQGLSSATASQTNAPPFHVSVVHGMEYLKEVGTQIQQALSNFGIDVDMDVQHSGVTEKVNKTKEEAKETPEEEKNEEEKADEVSEKKSEDEKRKNETENSQKEGDIDELNVPMKEMRISEGFQSPEIVEVEDDEKMGEVTSEDGMGDWTVMDATVTSNDEHGNKINKCPSYPLIIETGGCLAGTPFIYALPGPHNPHCQYIHPDANIANCVKTLEMMGFDNCNGWLTKFAIEYHGDVSAVVENIYRDKVYMEHCENTKGMP